MKLVLKIRWLNILEDFESKYLDKRQIRFKKIEFGSESKYSHYFFLDILRFEIFLLYLNFDHWIP